MDWRESRGHRAHDLTDFSSVTYSHGWKRILGEERLCSGGSFHRAYCKGATVRFEFEGPYSSHLRSDRTHPDIVGSHVWVVGHKSASHRALKINIDGQPGIATIKVWGGELIPFRNLFEHKFAEPGSHWIEVVNDLSGFEITIDSFACVLFLRLSG